MSGAGRLILRQIILLFDKAKTFGIIKTYREFTRTKGKTMNELEWEAMSEMERAAYNASTEDVWEYADFGDNDTLDDLDDYDDDDFYDLEEETDDLNY